MYKESTKKKSEQERKKLLVKFLIIFLLSHITRTLVQTPESIVQLKDLVQILEELEPFTVDIVKDSIKKICKEREIKLVVLAQPIRIALVGTTSSPGIFDLLALIGKQESVSRLHRLLTHVQM